MVIVSNVVRLSTNAMLQVYRRISVDGSSQAKGVGYTLERLAATFAPAAVSAYHKFGLTKTVIRAIIEGMCVFLLACMLLSGW